MTDSERFFRRADALLDRVETYLPDQPAIDFDTGVAWQWRRRGLAAGLKAIERINPVALADLHHIDHQKELLVRNTEQFLSGLPANNALLWGPRGTGKSSLVKALLNEFGPRGLKLIEVERDHLVDLPEIVDAVSTTQSIGHRFVVFCDDLSFDEKDTTYRALKVVLDGSVLATPDNVIIYATSNRRHLVPERLRDNLDATFDSDGEIHQSEAVEERISLSERFGLWVSFHPFNQQKYLDIVTHWLADFGVSELDDDSRRAALQWALLHGSRSGRSAQQFAKDWAGQKRLGPNQSDS